MGSPNKLCRARLVFPEDFGGNAVSGPSSLWCMQELRYLEGLHEARRGAGFLCQLAGTDAKRPLGIFSQTCNKSHESDGPHSHRTRSYLCSRDHFPRLVLARQLISQWSACLPSTISTRPQTFSWVHLSGAAFLRQSGRVLIRSPLRLGSYAGLTLHSRVASGILLIFRRLPNGADSKCPSRYVR